MKTIRVDVTQDMIDRATKGSAYFCPIELGIRAVVVEDLPARPGPYFGVLHHQVRFWADFPLRFESCPLPLHAEAFARRFDSGEEVSPIAFPLNIPDWVPLRETES